MKIIIFELRILLILLNLKLPYWITGKLCKAGRENVHILND